ncbi:hypothetical protein H5410_047839 [Solanum commersonii]|uniref:Uncharacterized protein n=1 Tax=Solanum commersonii TaxID=4109 RepID=A0A9J5XI48_SOLCO|nr:hypothetical protein H5410_047839 [Solanum commersonii]
MSLLNSGQLTFVIDYQSRFEDASLGYGDFNVPTSDIAYVSLQWSDITNSPLLQCCDEKFEGNNKTNVPKVFDNLSERSKDTSSIDISCKLSRLEVEDQHKAKTRMMKRKFLPSEMEKFTLNMNSSLLNSGKNVSNSFNLQLPHDYN